MLMSTTSLKIKAGTIRNETSHVKRRCMKKYGRVIATVTFLLGIGMAARAQAQDNIIVTLPFGFVAGEKALPAGTYKVSRFSNDPSGPLLFTNHDKEISVFVLPMASDGAPADKPRLTFEEVGKEHFLNTIHTSLGTYYIPVSHSGVTQAAATLRNSGAASGASGNE
jgi:hypothetical protein